MTHVTNDLDNGELGQHVQRMLIRHHAFQKIYSQLEYSFDLAPSLKKSTGVFIEGESGTGKSTLAEVFKTAHPKYRTEEKLVAPVIYAQVPEYPTIKSLASEILLDFEDPLANKGTEFEMTARILTYIKECETRVVILDEFQEFVDKSTNGKVLDKVANWLKGLINKTNIVVVIIGLPRGQKVLDHNEQLRGRFKRAMKMPRLDWSDEHLRDEFIGILEAATNLMRLRFDVPDFHDERLAYRFYLGSGGLLRIVFNIIHEAAGVAIRSGRTVIDMSDLIEGYDEIVHEIDLQSANPFSPDFNLNDGQAFQNAKTIGLSSDEKLLYANCVVQKKVTKTKQ
jgi:Cdc6-like AAA superfamily ATPase